MISLNGKTKLNNRSLYIYWTGQHAEHVAINAIEMPTISPLHQSIQKWLQTAKNFPLSGSNYVGYKEVLGGTAEIIWMKKSTFAVIKTGHIFESTTNLLKKNKAIGKQKKEAPVVTQLDEERLTVLRHVNISEQAYLKALNNYLRSKKKRRQ
ncbi:MAG: hypothetical protein EKK37_17410 [Sphingobacteriales bacterium]|nr:MAG: hypothetical protein EKK37_17410 [Sphingobacteriales bacterium]